MSNSERLPRWSCLHLACTVP